MDNEVCEFCGCEYELGGYCESPSCPNNRDYSEEEDTDFQPDVDEEPDEVTLDFLYKESVDDKTVSFDKFVDKILLEESSRKKVFVEDSPNRVYAKKYRELPQNRISFNRRSK
jgi:hypothetical protein